MSTEPQKQLEPSATAQHSFPPNPYHPQDFSRDTYPTPGPYPPHLANPLPEGTKDDSSSDSSHAATTFLTPLPYGMVYGYPLPPGQGLPSVLSRPKRQQVKIACKNCAAACKRCDQARPCERCIKYGIADTCVDGTRMEQKKGYKCGPYKQKKKPENGDLKAGEGEQNQTNPTISTATTSAALQAIGPNGLTQNATSQPQAISYTPPSGYPPYSHYQPPGSVPCAQHIQPQQTLDPSESATKPDEPRVTEQLEGAIATQTSKKSRASKNRKSKSGKSKGSGCRSQERKMVNASGEGLGEGWPMAA